MSTGGSVECPLPDYECLADLSDDGLELALQSIATTAEQQMSEISANVEAAAASVRFIGARKFNDPDAMEAAAADVITRVDLT